MEFKISFADADFQFDFSISARHRTPKVEDAIKQALSLLPVHAPGLVRVTDVGPNKIQVIKAVRTITDLGLKDAKDLVEKPVPFTLRGTGNYIDNSGASIAMLREAGAMAEIVTGA